MAKFTAGSGIVPFYLTLYTNNHLSILPIAITLSPLNINIHIFMTFLQNLKPVFNLKSLIENLVVLRQMLIEIVDDT